MSDPGNENENENEKKLDEEPAAMAQDEGDDSAISGMGIKDDIEDDVENDVEAEDEDEDEDDVESEDEAEAEDADEGVDLLRVIPESQDPRQSKEQRSEDQQSKDENSKEAMASADIDADDGSEAPVPDTFEMMPSSGSEGSEDEGEKDVQENIEDKKPDPNLQRDNKPGPESQQAISISESQQPLPEGPQPNDSKEVRTSADADANSSKSNATIDNRPSSKIPGSGSGSGLEEDVVVKHAAAPAPESQAQQAINISGSHSQQAFSGSSQKATSQPQQAVPKWRPRQRNPNFQQSNPADNTLDLERLERPAPAGSGTAGTKKIKKIILHVTPRGTSRATHPTITLTAPTPGTSPPDGTPATASPTAPQEASQEASQEARPPQPEPETEQPETEQPEPEQPEPDSPTTKAWLEAAGEDEVLRQAILALHERIVAVRDPVGKSRGAKESRGSRGSSGSQGLLQQQQQQSKDQAGDEPKDEPQHQSRHQSKKQQPKDLTSTSKEAMVDPDDGPEAPVPRPFAFWDSEFEEDSSSDSEDFEAAAENEYENADEEAALLGMQMLASQRFIAQLRQPNHPPSAEAIAYSQAKAAKAARDQELIKENQELQEKIAQLKKSNSGIRDRLGIGPGIFAAEGEDWMLQQGILESKRMMEEEQQQLRGRNEGMGRGNKIPGSGETSTGLTEDLSDEDADLQRAILASKQMMEEEQQKRYEMEAMARIAAMAGGGSNVPESTGPSLGTQNDVEDAALEFAMLVSKQFMAEEEATAGGSDVPGPGSGLQDDDDETALQRAILASQQTILNEKSSGGSGEVKKVILHTTPGQGTAPGIPLRVSRAPAEDPMRFIRDPGPSDQLERRLARQERIRMENENPATRDSTPPQQLPRYETEAADDLSERIALAKPDLAV